MICCFYHHHHPLTLSPHTHRTLDELPSAGSNNSTETQQGLQGFNKDSLMRMAVECKNQGKYPEGLVNECFTICPGAFHEGLPYHNHHYLSKCQLSFDKEEGNTGPKGKGYCSICSISFSVTASGNLRTSALAPIVTHADSKQHQNILFVSCGLGPETCYCSA